MPATSNGPTSSSRNSTHLKLPCKTKNTKSSLNSSMNSSLWKIVLKPHLVRKINIMKKFCQPWINLTSKPISKRFSLIGSRKYWKIWFKARLESVLQCLIRWLNKAKITNWPLPNTLTSRSRLSCSRVTFWLMFCRQGSMAPARHAQLLAFQAVTELPQEIGPVILQNPTKVNLKNQKVTFRPAR